MGKFREAITDFDETVHLSVCDFDLFMDLAICAWYGFVVKSGTCSVWVCAGFVTAEQTILTKNEPNIFLIVFHHCYSLSSYVCIFPGFFVERFNTMLEHIELQPLNVKTRQHMHMPMCVHTCVQRGCNTLPVCPYGLSSKIGRKSLKINMKVFRSRSKMGKTAIWKCCSEAR